MMKATLALALAGAVLIAGGGPGALARDKAPAYSPNQCFYTRMVTGFAAPDDQNLYLRVGVRDVYHFEMFGHCPDIDWNQRLALVSRGSSWICNGMDADVITHAVGIGRQRCPVRHMRKLTPQEVAALPPRARP